MRRSGSAGPSCSGGQEPAGGADKRSGITLTGTNYSAGGPGSFCTGRPKSKRIELVLSPVAQKLLSLELVAGRWLLQRIGEAAYDGRRKRGHLLSRIQNPNKRSTI